MLADLIYDLKRLAELSKQEGADIEDIHMFADNLLLGYINNDEVATAFRSIEKWYS